MCQISRVHIDFRRVEFTEFSSLNIAKFCLLTHATFAVS